MFVFSRRSIQNCLDELSDILPAQAISGWVERLNQVGKHRFATSWEPCLLHSLRRLGQVHYESPMTDGRKPDISFIYPNENSVGFVADITSISDEGLHIANPFHHFSQELAKAASTAGLNANHLRVDVRGRTSGSFGYEKTTLCLPPSAEIPEFINGRVVPFLNEITARRLSSHATIVGEDGIDLTISYNCHQRGMSGSYPAYDVRQSPKQNPLWTKLRDKGTKLKCSSDTALVGIIVCDGGSTLFHRTGSLGINTPKDVIHQFLAAYDHITFVLILAVDKKYPYSSSNMELRFRSEFHSRQHGTRIARIQDILSEMVAGLPQPIDDSANAYFRCRESGYGLGHLGGHVMTRRTVKISSRELLDLIAGRRTITELNEAHGWGTIKSGGVSMPSPFLRCLQEGRMIKRIEVAKVSDEDDDWVTIEFGDPDPAIAPFVAKSSSVS